MSEDKIHEVWIDPNPELWDETCPQVVKDHVTIAQQTLDRHGECNRCGSCCYYWDGKHKSGSKGELKPCKYLFNDDEGLPACKLWGTPELPDICRDFPTKPDLTNKHPLCGFSWTEKTQ